MKPNKEKLEDLVNLINSDLMIVINLPWTDQPHKISLTEDAEECSVTLDLGYTILKEMKDRPKTPVDDSSYKRLYRSLVSILFNDHLTKRENDFLNAKNKLENEGK